MCAQGHRLHRRTAHVRTCSSRSSASRQHTSERFGWPGLQCCTRTPAEECTGNSCHDRAGDQTNCEPWARGSACGALSLPPPPRSPSRLRLELHWCPTRRAGPSTGCAGVATSGINRPSFPLVGLDRRGIRSVYKHNTSSDSNVTGHGASRVAPTPRFGRQGYGQAGAGGWGWGGGVRG